MDTQHIQIQERQSRPIGTSHVTGIPASFWKSADCTVQRSPGDPSWILSAGDSVGISRITTPDGDITVEITAKLPAVDVFFLADYAFGQRHEPLRLLDFDDPLLSAVRNDPTACLLMWHALSISRFASRWLRRDYRTIDRIFDGKVKGRILLHQYAKNHLAIGEAMRIPCRTNERTQDTPNNRILRAGLRYAAKLSHTLPVPAAGVAVRRQVAATLPKFAQVTDIEPSPSDIRATSTRGPQRHYGSVLHATLNLLSHKFVTNELGGCPTQSFMWQMPVLFQEAVRGVVSTLGNVQLDNAKPPSVYISDGTGRRLRSSKVDPDLVMGSSGGKYLLLDTKYKNVLASAAPSLSDVDDEIIALPAKQRIKISRADIYQAAAYRQHERWPGATSGLLFPVSLGLGESLPQAMHIQGFGAPIPLVFIDIGPYAQANLGAFQAELDKLLQLTDYGPPSRVSKFTEYGCDTTAIA